MQHELERTLLAGLARTPEDALCFASGARARIAAAFQDALSGPDAALAVDTLLRFIISLRERFGGEAAAETLASVLRDEPRAQPYLQRYAPRGIDASRRFARQLGDGRRLAAPAFEGHRKKDGLRISDFLQPGAGSRNPRR